jgi:hypothetical protein
VPQQTLCHVSLVVSNHYKFELFSPTPEVLLKYQNAEGKIWEKKLDLERLANMHSRAEELALSDELAQLMYPITCDFHMWLTDKDGVDIESVRAEEPAMIRESVTMAKMIYPDGRELIYNRSETFVHVIQLGWISGSARTLQIEANMWPPTIFIQGNNKLKALRLYDLSQQALRAFTERVDGFIAEVMEFESARWFITPSDKPFGIRFPPPS